MPEPVSRWSMFNIRDTHSNNDPKSWWQVSQETKARKTLTTWWPFAEALRSQNARVSLKPQHAQTDASQAVPVLGTVPAPSLTIYVCGSERATDRDPAPANHVCEESIVDRQRPGSVADRVRSMVVMYVSDELVMVMVTATVARIPAQGLHDLTMVAEH